MITKYAQPISPRTQAFGAQPAGESEEQMFEDGFNQMAYNSLVSKFPDLVEEIVTFKVLEVDIESGAGVGAFVVQHNNDTLYIPVVMADNQLKPLDMFYHKNLNVFLPLSNEWLSEVDQLTLDEMGEASPLPKSLRRDVDIRNTVIPPTTGRYAYAAARGPVNYTQDLLQMLAHTQEKTAEVPPALLDFLRRAPNTVKVAFNNVLRSRQKLAAQVTQMYGLDPLCDALKLASATTHKGGALYVVDRDTPDSQFKEVFGDRAADAFQRVLKDGYAYKEDRGGLNKAVQVQTSQRLTEPTESGFYHVFDKDGTIRPAFVLHNPRSIHGHDTPEGRNGSRHGAMRFGQHNKEYIVVMNGGKWLRTHKLVGELLDSDKSPKNSDVFGKLMMGDDGDTPTAGSRGIFVVKQGKAFIGTTPFQIRSVSTDSKGVRRIATNGVDQTVLVTDKSAGRMGLHQPKGSPLMYIPADARFVKLEEESAYSTDLLRTATEVQTWFYDRFENLGATSFQVKNAGVGTVAIDGRDAMGPVEAMKTAALRFNIDFSAAENLVKQALQYEGYGVKAYVLTPAMNEKVAEDPMMSGAPPVDPATGAPMDPAMAGGDPSMGGAPPPPPTPPSPLDIAMGEAQTQIQQQMMDLQNQAMALQDKAQTLQTVGQRAQEIATGGAAAVNMGAPPMMPGGGGAPPPQDGAPMPDGGGAPTPPDPAMAGGMGGAPAPGEMMGGMSGAEPMPAAAAAMPPPQASMTTETPSASEIQQQVNPQFLEQAGQLGDTGAFDAAAISSMAQSPSFRDMVTDYVPTLERALDNLGRTLLSMWMQESELKEQIGEEQYVGLEDNIRAVFDGLGELVLSMNRNATVLGASERGL